MRPPFPAHASRSVRLARGGCRGSTGERPRHRRSGFTLVEVLLVVVIMAVLAGAVVSQFGSATADAKDATLRQNLQAIRKQWELFKVQHNGHTPGWTNMSDLGGHLFAYTDVAGDISTTPSPTHPYGPYWYGATTINPWNGATGAKLVLDPTGQTPDHDLVDGGEGVGWFLNPFTGQIAPNAEGTTSDGTPRIQL